MKQSTKDTLAVIGIIIAAGIFFWVGYGFIEYIGWGAPNS